MSTARGLSDAAVARLRAGGRWPELAGSRYTIVEEIGRGGMGTVFLAIDEELGREVAIKIPNGLGSDSFERRLHSEARLLARLEHPGIVPIHDIGRLADGRLFYVMKRVQGRTLAEHNPDVRELSERVRLFERICEPVAFAHDRGFIHRDLKPENVMVGSFGEVMVMDWGVAKDSRLAQSADDSSATATSDSRTTIAMTGEGTVIGTVGFMAPEQARGDAAAVDVRADVYGLGALLFFLVTSKVPGGSEDESLRSARVPRALAAICLKALEPDPLRRYQSVADLADDVGRYRSNGRVAAHRETWLERTARFGRTHRTAILLILAYIVMRTAVALLAGR